MDYDEEALFAVNWEEKTYELEKRLNLCESEEELTQLKKDIRRFNKENAPAHFHIIGLLYEMARERINGIYGCCSVCQLEESFKPSHKGSKNCESGSIASGGTKSHCSCDICF